MTDPIEARLDAIETGDFYDDTDIAWLVALVRRYRAALETAVVVIADGWPSTETAVHGHSRAETCLACDLSEALEAEAGLERDKPRCSGA